MSKVKDALFTDREPPESLMPDPEYNPFDPVAGQVGALRGMNMDEIHQYPPEFFGEDLPAFFADFATAQGELQDAHKDQQAYQYKYADLSQVLQIARPVLSRHGIGLIQLLGNAGDNVSVTTLLVHKGGAGVKTVSSMPVGQPGKMSHAQAVGSISTYLRRYSVAAIVGITQTDNDAEHVPQHQKREKAPKKAAAQPNPDVIKALQACEDIPTLVEMWGKLSKAEHLLYAGVKDAKKDELQLAQADKDQELL